jgi:Na+/H+ antiporter NhaD/arsenite permease-like protein
MSLLLFIILFVVSLFCLYFAIVCLIVAYRENDLPDIEDLETQQDS